MSALLVFSDLHLRPESEAICIGILREIRKEARAMQINEVAFLGDFYHLRYEVPVHLLNAVHEELQQWYGLQLHMLAGNHDQVDEAGRNALEIFDALHNVTVYTTPRINAHGVWIPYTRKQEVIDGALAEARTKGAKVVFAHLPIKGSMMNNLIADEDGYAPGMFRGFQKVLLGHYHKRQTIGACQYIGSPWQTRADEYGQPKGFAVWDGSRLVFHDRKWAPEHHRVTVATAAEALACMGAVGSQDRVKILVTDAAEAEAVRAAVGAVAVVEAPEAPVLPRLGLGVSATWTEYASAYVAAKKSPELDAAKVLATFEELIQ